MNIMYEMAVKSMFASKDSLTDWINFLESKAKQWKDSEIAKFRELYKRNLKFRHRRSYV